MDIEAAGNTGEELVMIVQVQAALVGWSVDAALLFRCAERADDNWSWAARQKPRPSSSFRHYYEG